MCHKSLVAVSVSPPYYLDHANGYTTIRKGGSFPPDVMINLPDGDKAIYDRLSRDQAAGHNASLSIPQIAE